MITVEVKTNQIAIRGHARAGPKGQDIVCASVSVLFQTLITSIETFTKDKIGYSLKPGDAYLRWNGNLSERAKLLIDSFFIGICGVASAYPENINIKANAAGAYANAVGAEKEKNDEAHEFTQV